MNRRARTRYTALLLTAGLFGGLVACASPATEPAADGDLDCSTAPEASGDPVNIRIATGAAAEEPVWLMGEKPELTPQQGKSYSLELKSFDDSEKKLVGYQAGDVDAVVVPMPALIVGTARGALDLVPLFTVMQEAGEGAFGTSFVVKGDSDIKSVEDLKGATIGILDFRSTPDFVARMGLKQGGYSPEDATFVTLPFPAQLEALNSGVVDVAAVAEPFATMATSGPDPARIRFSSQDVVGHPYDQLVVSVDREFAQKNLRAVCDLRDDYAGVVEWYQGNKDEAKTIIAEAGYIKYPLDIYLKAKDYARPEAGAFDPSEMAALMDDMESVGLLKKDERVDVDSLYVTGFTAGN